MFRPKESFYEKRGHVWYSEGVTPICGSRNNPSPHVALPVGEYNAETRCHYVLDQGTIVSVQDGMLVPCNGGVANTVTYQIGDVSAGVIDPTKDKKVVAGETFEFKANKPIGFLVWDVFQNPETLPNGYKVDTTQTAPTIRTEGAIMIPMVYMPSESISSENGDEDGNYKKRVKAYYEELEVGDLVCADIITNAEDASKMKVFAPTAKTGGFRKWVEGKDKIPQIVGRVIAIENDYEFSTQGLEFIKADGVDVQSDSTHGFPRHIWNAFKDSKTDSTKREKYIRKVIIVNLETRK